MLEERDNDETTQWLKMLGTIYNELPLIAALMKKYEKEISQEYRRLIQRCQKKKEKDETRLKRLLRREQRIRDMRRLLETETSSSSEDDEESRAYEDLC